MQVCTLGFSRAVSERLVQQTMKGSVEYAIQSKRHAAELRNQVTSPGGTTAAALYRLEKGRIAHDHLARSVGGI